MKIDYSKPLSEAVIEDLKSRLPMETVQYHISRAGGVEADKVEDLVEDDESVDEMSAERLQEVAHKVADVVDALEDRAETLGIELEAFPKAPEVPVSSPEEGSADVSNETLFDPSEKDVDGVLEYLLTASDEETARVKAAEAAGKDRKGIREA